MAMSTEKILVVWFICKYSHWYRENNNLM